MISHKGSLVGKIVTYAGACSMWRSVWYMEAGIVTKETANQVMTTCIFGSITRVNKRDIFGVHDKKDEEKVKVVCQRTKDIRNNMTEEIAKKKRWAQEAIEGIANGYEI